MIRRANGGSLRQSCIRDGCEQMAWVDVASGKIDSVLILGRDWT